MTDSAVAPDLKQPASNRGRPAPLEVLRTVLDKFEQSGLSYCHWKSNYHIDYALTGREDVDVLIQETDFREFVHILLERDFKQADSVTNRKQPGVFHFLGNDTETGTLMNIHAYTRILTGDHFLKSWALPFEQLLLCETSRENSIRLPPKTSELIIFVIRNMIKHTTLFDLFLAYRSSRATVDEYLWLMEGMDPADSLQKLNQYFPEISASDFHYALQLLASEGQLPAKIWLGFRFRAALKKYRRYGQLKQSLYSAVAAFQMAIAKFGRKEKHMNFLTGGKIIALVGPQATGKSTLAESICGWLGQELAVRTVHAGKPPSTWLTFVPNYLIPLARALLPGQTSLKVELKAEASDDIDYPLVFLIRRVMLAYDRRALLRSVYRNSRNGKIVLSDRYPSDAVGAIDGATFSDEKIVREPSALKRFLMKQERRIYRDICSPDLVLQLTVSTEKAVERNRTRDKKGNQTTEYVRARHSQRVLPEFHHCPVVTLSTDTEFDETLLEVKREVWKRL